MLNPPRRFKFTGSNTRTICSELIWKACFLEREKQYVEKTIKQFSGIENIQKTCICAGYLKKFALQEIIKHTHTNTLKKTLTQTCPHKRENNKLYEFNCY